MMMTSGWRWGCVAVAMGLAFACSNSGSSGGSYSGTDCPSEGVTSGACISCLEAQCSSELTALNEGCTSSDLSCACPSGANPESCDLSSECQTAGPDYQACIQENCAADCSTTGGGGTPEDSGSTAGGCSLSGGGACQVCEQTNCCAADVACTGNSECLAYGDCLEACGDDDNSCLDTCAETNSGGVADYNAISACITGTCASACQ
jgi:hypothetical protein